MFHGWKCLAQVAKQFVRLYYSILNTHHEYLHQFYGPDSAIVVSEMLEGGTTMTESADTQEVNNCIWHPITRDF